jgi:wyosine [tRNA(Phe)-imidazoG37] synthetase (radical SAM superfamily)
MIAFGPIPSRRLGRSLGVNNIPPKACSYSCVYCQVGRTIKMQVERQAFYEPEDILQAVHDKVEKAKEAGESIDYLTFVPDGEPTLDVNLGREIDLLKPLGIRIAVISNSSLIWRQDVREALLKADWVSLKMDAVQEEVWRRVNRPHGALRLDAILDGALEFAGFEGKLVTETMLVAGVNDGVEHLGKVADFLARLRPAAAYLSIPIRPPAEAWVRPPGEDIINQAYQILSGRLDRARPEPVERARPEPVERARPEPVERARPEPVERARPEPVERARPELVERVEYLIGYEGNAFAFTGDVEDDLLSITAVHPMREDAVGEFLARARARQRAGANWTVVRDLIARGSLVETEYAGRKFYVRKIH